MAFFCKREKQGKQNNQNGQQVVNIRNALWCQHTIVLTIKCNKLQLYPLSTDDKTTTAGTPTTTASETRTEVKKVPTDGQLPGIDGKFYIHVQQMGPPSKG